MAGEGDSRIFDDLMRFKPDHLTPNAWAVMAGVSRTVWTDMRRHGNPSRRTLEKLLKSAGSSLAEFEALRIGAAAAVDKATAGSISDRSANPWGGPQLPGLPLLATAPAGEWRSTGIEMTELRPGEIVGRVPRPVSMARDANAYAITIVGEAMWPRFRRGRVVAVSRNSAVEVGDDVIVQLKIQLSGTKAGATAVLIKELVGRSASSVELRQFHPDRTLNVPTKDVDSIDKILGEIV